MKLIYTLEMQDVVKKLSVKDQKALFQDLNYLNMKEYQNFCKDHHIPYHVYIETDKGLKKTDVTERKEIVLKKIVEFLKTSKVPGPTLFRKKIINTQKNANYTSKTKIYFGQYDKTNKSFNDEMKKLTKGSFKDGMIARETIRDFWMNHKAPTLIEFASSWMKANAENLENTKKRPQYAYLTDLCEGKIMEDWKQLRAQKAKNVLSILKKIGKTSK